MNYLDVYFESVVCKRITFFTFMLFNNYFRNKNFFLKNLELFIFSSNDCEYINNDKNIKIVYFFHVQQTNKFITH